jgi:HSP20 family molecular chaperone IbpA
MAEQTNDKSKLPGAPVFEPDVDIVEFDDRVEIRLDLPGVKSEGLEIEFDRGVLSVEAKVEPRRSPDSGSLVREYGVGDYRTRFRVGEKLQAGEIEAELKNGELVIKVMKPAEAKPKKVAVKPIGV